MFRNASKVSFYRKGQGEVQFNFIPPTWEEVTADRTRVTREGTILVEAARALPNTERSDWANKIRFGIGVVDIAKIITGLTTEGAISLVHKHPTEGHISRFEISPGERGGFKMQVSGKQVGTSDMGTTFVYVDPADIRTVVILLEFALPRCLGWDKL